MNTVGLYAIEGNSCSGKSRIAEVLKFNFTDKQKKVVVISGTNFRPRAPTVNERKEFYASQSAENAYKLFSKLMNVEDIQLYLVGMSKTIQVYINNGYSVIFDSYKMTAIAFLASHGIPLYWCRLLNYLLPHADSVFYATNDDDGLKVRQETIFHQTMMELKMEWAQCEHGKPFVRVPDIETLIKLDLVTL